MARTAVMAVLLLAMALGAWSAMECIPAGPVTRTARVDPGQAVTVMFVPACATKATTYYLGNFTVQSTTAFTLRIGDQPCDQFEYDNSNFDFAPFSVTDYFEHTERFGYYALYDNYATKAQIFCDALAGRACEVSYRVCMGVYPRS